MQRTQRMQRKVLHKEHNVCKKWPMTWLEFVTWYGIRQIRTFYFSCEACFGPGVACVACV